MNQNTVTLNGQEIPIDGAKNLLEMTRRIGIDIPTFCYHSELSVYGACRLCLVDIEGRGVVASCSTQPQPGMVVRTHTSEIREIRKITMELMLANHEPSCTTCGKNARCKLQEVARQVGVEEVRFDRIEQEAPVDRSAPSLVRDPNKCILCGDCVRMCHEVQGIGAIDFAHRGSDSMVLPAFGKDLNEVECVHCGQCARVCPTGALTPALQDQDVWAALDDSDAHVIAQIAPAVRVGIGEYFGLEPGKVLTGKIVGALRALGFDGVYDTSFAADMTVVEEATEFLGRFATGENLPQFTSCCPAWVKTAEQYFPDLLDNLSSCKSPQAMFGSLAKKILPDTLGEKKLVVVSIMPCTAKKFEAKREELNGDVDFVLTTQELGRMIEQGGIRFNELAPGSLDMPFGFKTGAGVIFGNSGGVTEAVLRFAYEKATSKTLQNVDFLAVRGQAGLREATIDLDGTELRLAIVHGLENAQRVASAVQNGKADYHLIEVMACPGGCINGAGQPYTHDETARAKRTRALYDTDKTLQLHKSQDNPMLAECYEKHLGEAGGPTAHALLHTKYQSRARSHGTVIDLHQGSDDQTLNVSVCLGTSCHLKGSRALLQGLVKQLDEKSMGSQVDVQGTLCFENCQQAPNVQVGETIVGGCTVDTVMAEITNQLNG